MDMPSQPDADHLLARGDALRDRRDWAQAAEAYAAYLGARPQDWPIWVQYGHCLKEGGDARAALLAYREAERLAPEDSDVQLQIGHALKLLGRMAEALEAYARALQLDPGNRAAQAELDAPDAPAPEAEPHRPAAPSVMAAAPVQADGIVFDASDLLDWFAHNRAPTGIQRVQLNLIGEALARGAGTVAAFAGGAWKPVPETLFLRLRDLSSSGTALNDPPWVAALAELRTALDVGPPLGFPRGATLVNLGTSWWSPDYLRHVRAAKARHGLRYVPFLHDCIPLLVPERCPPALVEEFARWFAGLCLHADAVIANSRSTAADFYRLSGALLQSLEIPCAVLPLDAAPAPVEPAPPAIARPYVLFVGTIESRKDHLLAFNTWIELVRRHGEAAVPDLVCVGKRGWLAEAALALHANSSILRARVRLLHDVSDAALAGLYRDCLFTLYNSYYEGWGLPVTESLAHGKVPVVPDHPSLREAGGEAACYVTPQCVPSLLAALERLIFDTAWRTEREALVAATTRLRSWGELADQLLAEVAAGAATVLPPPLHRASPVLGAVHELRLLRGEAPLLAMAVADALREGPGWGPLEGWGCWAGPGAASIRLPLPPQVAGQPLRAHLSLLGAPDAPGRVTLRAEGGPACTLDMAPGERVVCALTVPAAGPELAIGIEGRIGVVSLMVCRADDLAARVDWLEGQALPRMVVA